MPRYRNTSTGVVVNLPAEQGDQLRGYEPVASERPSSEPSEPTPRRRRVTKE